MLKTSPTKRDIDGLIAGLIDMSARRGLASRYGARMLCQEYAPVTADDHVIKDGDFPEIERDIKGLDADSALLAQVADALGEYRQMLDDDAQAASPTAASTGASLLSRALSAIAGPPAVRLPRSREAA